MDEDKEIEKFLEEDLKKDLTQEDNISPEVEEQLGEMGFLWDRVSSSLKKQKTCFACKKTLEASKEKVNVLEANTKEKGCCSFVSICKKCYSNMEKVHKNDP